MMEIKKIKAPLWFLIVAVICVLWDLMGVMSFFQYTTMSDEAIQALPEAEQSLYRSLPLWTTIAYAVAVFGGTIGSIGLLIRKKWAKPVFIISLVAVLAQMYYNLFVAHTTEVYGPGALIMPVMIILIAFFQIWLANFGIRKAWLS